MVGAGGFVGGFLVEEGLCRGWDVYAGVRATTSRRYLADPRIRFVELDFENPSSLAGALEEQAPDGGWDYIVYNLGATKVGRYADFSRINYDYLRYFTEALRQAGLQPKKFLYMSSLSVLGPIHEKDYRPFTESDIPRPDTRYGASKLKAEMWLLTSGLPYIIFRPTGVYGPRDKDYFLMFESIRKGFDFSVGYKKQMLTFIYVEDLARAVYDALEHGKPGEVYHISEGKGYSQKEFRRLSMEAMKKRFVMPMRMPLWGVKGVSWIAEKWGVARAKPSTLNSDKYRIMKQRNWLTETGKAKADFGFEAEVPLEEGIRRSVEWYEKEGWL